MHYDFFCEKCGNEKQIVAPIQEGPPSVVKCECGEKMSREFSTNFILRGSWPGKDIKRANTMEGSDEEINNFEKKRDKVKKNKDLKEEVLKERRKGTKHMKEWRRKNQTKWEKYTRLNK